MRFVKIYQKFHPVSTKTNANSYVNTLHGPRFKNIGPLCHLNASNIIAEGYRSKISNEHFSRMAELEVVLRH